MAHEKGFEAVALTKPPQHHFFGYYGVYPWDASDQHMLCLESPFDDRLPEEGDVAVIGLVDHKGGEFQPITETHAWNLQQGCWLHWLPAAPDRQILYNDRMDDRFVSVIVDIHSGQKRVLPRAINGLSNDGRWAVCHNYGRLRANRPVVGYAGPPDPRAFDPHPDDDGIHLLDTRSGKVKLLVTFQQVYELIGNEEARERPLWLNMGRWSPDDRRFLFVARWRPGPDPSAPYVTHLCVIKRDGTGLGVINSGYVSHQTWRDPETILAWMDLHGHGRHYYLMNIETGAYEIVGASELTMNGHVTYSRDRRWFLTDTYPDAQRMQTLTLWNVAEKRQVVLGRFYAPPWATGPVRCDLHPRWNRSENLVCFDSVHEGTRQVYVVDVSSVVCL